MAFQIAYQRLFELSIWHHHFLDPLTGGAFSPPPTNSDSDEQRQLLLDYDIRRFMKIQPTERSVEFMRQLGLIYKNSNKGCLVASRTSLAAFDSSDKITLIMRVTAPDFYNYSNFDFTYFEDKIFYLTNFGTPAASRILLSAPDVLADVHRQSIKSRNVRLAQLNPGNPPTETINVLDVNTNPTVQILQFIEQSQPNQPEYELDCRNLREGLYRFEAGNITDEDYFLGLENRGGLIGVVDIYLQGLNEQQFDIRIDSN